MRQLEDHERGAFHYLLGGVVVVGLLRVLASATGRLGGPLAPELAALLPFQQGYPLLRGEWASVATAAGLTERLVQALVVATGAAFLMGLALLAAATVRKRGTGRAGLVAMRASLLLVLGWSVYAAFYLPIRSVQAERGTLVFRERTALVGDIPLPFTLREHRMPGTHVLRLEGGTEPPARGRQGTAWIDLVTAQGTQRIGQVRMAAEQELALLRAASMASAGMERELR